MASHKQRTDDSLQAGDLRHRVTFLSRQVTVKSGITTERWVAAFSCWAMAQPFSGREYWSAAAIGREHEQRFTIRFRRDVEASMRVLFDGCSYDITSLVNPNARCVKLEILAKTVVPDEKVRNV